jgi:iron complex outermembrane receptor protein
MGSYSQVNAQAMINTPLSDQLAFRAAFNVTAHDGYLSNGTADDDTKSMRLKLGYKPSDKISSILTYEYTKIGGVSKYGFVVPFEDEGDVDDPWTSTIPGGVYRADRTSNRFILNLNVSTPIGEVTFLPSISRYQEHNRQQDPLKVRPDGSPILGGGPPGAGTTIGWRSQIRNHRQEETSIELRIASPDDFFMKYLLGVYYYKMNWNNHYTKERTEMHNDLGDGGIWPDVLSWSIQENPSKSAFGNFTYPVTDAFRVTAGGRYTSDKENRHGYDSTGGRSGQDFYNASGPFENSHFDYKAGAEYDLNPNTMLWVDYSTGYKMGFQGRPAQTLKAYQAGEKGRFLDQRLQLNATAFYYDYQNFQINAGSIEVDGLEYMGSGMAKAQLYGLDLSTKYLISQQDDISISIAYLNSSINNATVIYSNMMTGVELDPVVLSSNLPGLNGTPKITITGSYNHIFDLSGGGNVTASVNPRYVTEKTLMFQPTAVKGYDVDKLNTEPTHLMLDASLTYYNADGKWNINAYGKNLTNHAEKTGFYMGLDFLQIGAPRTFGATVSVKF